MICELCGEKFKRVTHTHLRNRHGTSAAEYFGGSDRARFELFWSLYGGGLSAAQVAVATSTPVSTVKRVLGRRGVLRSLSEAQRLGWVKFRSSREATTLKGLHSEEARAKRIASIARSPIFRDACSERQARLWRDPEYRGRMLSCIGRKTPNQAERYLENLINEHGFPYRFVGDRSVLIGGLNPDFIHAGGGRKVIELFGGHWHDPARAGLPESKTESGRRRIYGENGYRLLVVWYGELSDDPEGVVRRIREFDAR